jgi:hypothetical protein
MRRAATFSLALVLALVASACDPDTDADDGAEDPIVPGDPRFERDPSLDVPLVSKAGDTTSHLNGENCMRCHQQFGPGTGRFTIGGSLYTDEHSTTPMAGGTIELRTAPLGEGELVFSLEVDANGNFYSTDPLPFPEAELFPWVRSSSGAGTNGMEFPVSSGACNACHTPAVRVNVQ